MPVSGCVVKASEFDLTPVWKGQGAGLAVIVSRDGEAIYTTSPRAADASGDDAFSDVDVEIGTAYSYQVVVVDADGNESEPVSCGSGQLLAQSSDVACGVRVSDVGLPEVSWDGVLLVQQVAVLRDGVEIAADTTTPFVDSEAPPDAVSSYSIAVSDATGQGRVDQTVECGEATPNVAETGGVYDLAGAIEASRSFMSPYQYVRLEPICPGCRGTAELYLTPAAGGVHVIEQAWVDGVAVDRLDQLWMLDPLTVAATLDEAQRSGSSITFDIDVDTGLVREWTIDGVGARYDCVEIDTAPLESRDRDCTIGIFER